MYSSDTNTLIGYKYNLSLHVDVISHFCVQVLTIFCEVHVEREGYSWNYFKKYNTLNNCSYYYLLMISKQLPVLEKLLFKISYAFWRNTFLDTLYIVISGSNNSRYRTHLLCDNNKHCYWYICIWIIIRRFI